MQTKLTLFTGVTPLKVLPFAALFLSLVGLGLSLWIVIPAPTFALLTLGVGAPEVSPWLVVFNLLALLLTIAGWRYGTFSAVTLSLVSGGLVLSLWPLLQIPATTAQMQQTLSITLGADYLKGVPASVQAHFRPEPFSLPEALLGAPTLPTREVRGVPLSAADGSPLTVNIYLPLKPGHYPAVAVLYGGAWQHGSPDSDASFNRYLAAQGYVIFALDYRHAPKYRFPAQIEDVNLGLAWIDAHARDYEADPTRLAVLGRSAGAQLALLAAYRPQAHVQAVISFYGPVDLSEGYLHPPLPDPINSRQVLKLFLGGTLPQMPENYRQASPIHLVRPGLPPTLLIYGGRDHVVQAKYGQQLQILLREQGNQAVFLAIPWAEHAFDLVFHGLSSQLAQYETERFLAWALYHK